MELEVFLTGSACHLEMLGMVKFGPLLLLVKGFGLAAVPEDHRLSTAEESAVPAVTARFRA